MPDSKSPSTSTPDDFDQVLKDLARPSSVGAGFVVKVASAASDALTSAVARAVRDAAPGSEPQPGDVLEGRYRITGVLGRGGMGVVLEAEQLRTGKVVAIKWMNSAHETGRSAAQVGRFLREARAVANIQHPNVVDLHDVGDSAGVPFLVLERLRGQSLRSRLEAGPLSWRDATRLLLGVLSGLDAVHRAGIVHRDLKPDNIFLAIQNDEVIPKVLDFGVAAVRAGNEDGLDALTRTGALLGTPAYMALEQLTGAAVDQRADLYALGVVFYEMLTGRLPFEARSAADLAVSQATQRPAPPSRLVTNFTGRQDAVVMRALARRPEERFADSAEFAAALHEILRPRRGLLQSRGFLTAAALALVGGAAATLGGFVATPGRRESNSVRPAISTAAARSAAAPLAEPPAATISERSAQAAETDASDAAALLPEAAPMARLRSRAEVPASSAPVASRRAAASLRSGRTAGPRPATGPAVSVHEAVEELVQHALPRVNANPKAHDATEISVDDF